MASLTGIQPNKAFYWGVISTDTSSATFLVDG